MENEFLLSEIAKLYYIDQMKQKDIANLFKITPIQVSRLLKTAVDNHLIQFHITMPIEIDFEMGKQLKDKFHLRECVVINELNPSVVLTKMSQYLAQFVSSLMQSGSIMGVSWGRGIYDFTKQLPFLNLQNVKIVQLSGGVFSESDYMVTPAHIVTTACEKLNSIPIFLNAPFFFPNIDTKTQMLQDTGIQRVYELAKSATVNIIGTSPLKLESTVSRVGIVSAEDIAELSEKGAVGDIAGYFIDKEGNLIDWSKSQLYSGVPLELIYQAETSICIAGEVEKATVLRASLSRNYYNTLITSKQLAENLLEATH